MPKFMELGSTLHLEPGSWQEAIFDICIGVVTGAGHFLYYLQHWFVAKPVYALTGIRLFDDKPQLLKEGEGELKVVGVGFGRTGTYSLALALDELGFPTLHTQHLYENEDIFEMWVDSVFQPSLDKGHAELGFPDWDVIAQHGYQATMDFPTALYYEQILQKYPNCKFILTTRQDSETWFRSWDNLAKSITTPANVAGSFISGVQRYSIYLRWLYGVVNKDDGFLTSKEPRDNQNHDVAIKSYESHNARVRQLIPSDQLLEFSVKDGWAPLCIFLQVTDKCPTTPFPKTNSARSVQVQSASSTLVPAFRRATGMTVVEWVHLQTNLIQNRLRKSMRLDPKLAVDEELDLQVLKHC
eukprot:scaffold918_cov126-Cylindrotheca_fusiformis.AAC.42